MPSGEERHLAYRSRKSTVDDCESFSSEYLQICLNQWFLTIDASRTPSGSENMTEDPVHGEEKGEVHDNFDNDLINGYS